MMSVGLMIIHGAYDIPFRGDPVLVGASASLLIIAYLSLGAAASSFWSATSPPA